jgi:hypothetical protein
MIYIYVINVCRATLSSIKDCFIYNQRFCLGTTLPLPLGAVETCGDGSIGCSFFVKVGLV